MKLTTLLSTVESHDVEELKLLPVTSAEIRHESLLADWYPHGCNGVVLRNDGVKEFNKIVIPGVPIIIFDITDNISISYLNVSFSYALTNVSRHKVHIEKLIVKKYLKEEYVPKVKELIRLSNIGLASSVIIYKSGHTESEVRELNDITLNPNDVFIW